MQLKPWVGDLQQFVFPNINTFPRQVKIFVYATFFSTELISKLLFSPFFICDIYLDIKIFRISFLIKYSAMLSTVDFKLPLRLLEAYIIQVIKLISMVIPKVL